MPRFAFALCGAALLLAFPVFAEDAPPANNSQTVLQTPDQRIRDDDAGIFSVTLENDLFAGTDSNYTNGIRFAWLSSETGAPDWARWLGNHLLISGQEGKKRISLAAGQNMYTPRDLTIAAPQPDDRPYAGWLYGTAGIISDTGKTLDSAQLTVGMVGPSALAAQTQDFIHDTIGSPDPQGWDNQLKDELGVVLTYERKWRNLYEFSPFGMGVDFTPSVGVNLGNVYTDASFGGVVRFGRDLPADYGPPRIRPSLPGSDFFIPTQEIGWYLFAGAEGRAVARNIFLDGNTFKDSLSVDKEPLVGSVQAGVALTYGETRLSYTHVLMTKEFEGQDNAQQFGAVSLSTRF